MVLKNYDITSHSKTIGDAQTKISFFELFVPLESPTNIHVFSYLLSFLHAKSAFNHPSGGIIDQLFFRKKFC